MWASLVSWLVAGAVADGDGIDAYMGGDGAADGAGAGVYIVLACERLADELLLLGGAGREHAHAGARVLGQNARQSAMVLATMRLAPRPF